MLYFSTISNDEINLQDFTVFRKHRNRHGGGVALYAHVCLSPSQLITDTNIESVWVSINRLLAKITIRN